MNRRGFLSALAGAGVGATAGCADVSHPLPPLQGIVRRQSIVARDADGARRLLALSAGGDGPVVRGAELGEALPRADERANVTVPAAVGDALADAYDAVRYRIAVRPLDPNGPLVPASPSPSPSPEPGSGEGRTAADRTAYALSRSSFNDLLVGDRIEFTLDPTGSNRVGGLVTIVRRGTVREKLSADERDGDDSADDPRAVFAHEGVGRRGYVVSPAPFDTLDVGRRYRFRAGIGHGSRQRIEEIVRPESLPAFGNVN